MSIRIDVIPNQFGSKAVLLRKTWCEGKRVRHKTIANLSHLDPNIIEGFKAVLKGGVVGNTKSETFNIHRALPHGHVAAILTAMKQLGFERLLGRRKDRNRDLAIAAIAARIITPDSKLATARTLDPDTATTSLGTLLELGPVSGNDMLDMLDWLLDRQPWIERSLATRHLKDSTTILYDVSSSYLEGRCCPLAAFGHNRDGKTGKMQITFGLLCAANGCPVAVEVFAGNASDPSTVRRQVDKLRKRFRLENIALVGDRGMLTTARIENDLRPLGLDWISALRTSGIRALLKSADGAPAVLEPDRLVADSVTEILSPDFPGERLMVCLNPRLRDERRRKREALLDATEDTLIKIATAAARRKPGSANRDRILKALGREANRRKMEKHFDIVVEDDGLAWSRNAQRIAQEAKLDGIYVVRTSLAPDVIGSREAVEAYKSLSCVEWAFRQMKLTRLRVRPIHVRTEKHVRAHVFLCMLAWHVELHMRRTLAPLLFEDDDRPAARSRRRSPVEPAEVSVSAERKAEDKTTSDGLPVHSFSTLLADLGTLTLNHASLSGHPDSRFFLAAEPTKLQKRAFELLGTDADRLTYINKTA